MVKSLLVPFILWSAVAFCSNIVIDILSQRISIGDIIRTQFIDIFVYARLVWFLLILFIVDIIYIIVYAAGIVWLVYFVSKYFCEKYQYILNIFGKKIKNNYGKERKIMKVVILAGGFGTRISEESYLKPKPMLEIGGKPILWHIMKEYSYYGYNDFIICCVI